VKLTLCGHEMKNPVIAASGTFGYGREYEDYYDPAVLGGISSKGLTLQPQKGNPGQRLHETPMGLMNSIGLQNPGVEWFIEHELADMLTIDTLTLVNLGGHSMEDYITGAQLLDKTEAPVIELNISCPNVDAGGMAFGIRCHSASAVVREVRQATKKTLLVKLSPNAENIVDMALACEEAGADAVSLVNTFQAMAIDVHAKKPVFHRVFFQKIQRPCFVRFRRCLGSCQKYFYLHRRVQIAQLKCAGNGAQSAQRFPPHDFFSAGQCQIPHHQIRQQHQAQINADLQRLFRTLDISCRHLCMSNH
jgi:hypothetical protein